MKKYKLGDSTTENLEEAELTQCNYDKENCCYCMTYSILSEDGTHYNCGKCGAIK